MRGSCRLSIVIALGSGQNRGGFVCCTMLPTDPCCSIRTNCPHRRRSVRSPSGPHPVGHSAKRNARSIARSPGFRCSAAHWQEEKRRLDRLLVFHAAEIRPRTDRAVALRVGLVRALAPFLDDRRLTKAQHRVLRRILVEQLDDVLTHLEKPDPDLQALFERLHDVSYAQAVQDDIKEAQAGMAAIFDELGLDIEVPELRADMTEEDAAAAAAQLADELRRAEEKSDAAKPQPRHGKSARAAEERARRLRAAAEGQPGSRLPSARQGDAPGPRARSGRARKEGPRHAGDHRRAHPRRFPRATPARTRVAWCDRAATRSSRATKSCVRTPSCLKQQATELEDEVQSLRLHPRYAPLIVEGPFGFPVVIDGPREVERLDTDHRAGRRRARAPVVSRRARGGAERHP